jgi:hypothetical protein
MARETLDRSEADPHLRNGLFRSSARYAFIRIFRRVHAL